MKAFDNSKTMAMLAVSATLLLGACSPQPKTSSTASSYSVDEYGNTVKTTVTKEVETAPPRTTPEERASALPPASIDSDVDLQDEVDLQSEPEVSRIRVQQNNVKVRAPFVDVDTNENSGKVHVRAPFVRIDKNGHGDRTTIHIPGITIRGD